MKCDRHVCLDDLVKLTASSKSVMVFDVVVLGRFLNCIYWDLRTFECNDKEY